MSKIRSQSVPGIVYDDTNQPMSILIVSREFCMQMMGPVSRPYAKAALHGP